MLVMFVIKLKSAEVFACPSGNIDPAIVGYTGTVAYAYAFESEAHADRFAIERMPFNLSLKNYEIKRIIELTP